MFRVVVLRERQRTIAKRCWRSNGHILQRGLRLEFTVALGTARACMFRTVMLVMICMRSPSIVLEEGILDPLHVETQS